MSSINSDKPQKRKMKIRKLIERGDMACRKHWRILIGKPFCVDCKKEGATKTWKEKLIAKLSKYKCDFNWDFERNKPKHKSYIALDDVIKLINNIK